ncbi:preprotein translocase subunit SecE [Anaerorhabdus sp.]|jgi:preprotein translocase SecE subunit|uniref:preprotein translocase subunit SecE n=1 Tax=Anaerorhabdus sp. TaxID=1872524 RepID=UPI002B2117DB|nr:preprotein translocase subunit SecE [Anaerorhabdus sp.]MEA4874864.1 preprotein translocase subunit SecE [Anaerorhabdus sp.]
MLKWFSFDGIMKEAKRIRWPKTKELMSTMAEVLLFIVFFGTFFVVCEFLITFFLKVIGIGA